MPETTPMLQEPLSSTGPLSDGTSRPTSLWGAGSGWGARTPAALGSKPLRLAATGEELRQPVVHEWAVQTADGNAIRTPEGL